MAVGALLLACLVTQVVGDDMIVLVHAALHLRLPATGQEGEGCGGEEWGGDLGGTLHGRLAVCEGDSRFTPKPNYTPAPALRQSARRPPNPSCCAAGVLLEYARGTVRVVRLSDNPALCVPEIAEVKRLSSSKARIALREFHRGEHNRYLLDDKKADEVYSCAAERQGLQSVTISIVFWKRRRRIAAFRAFRRAHAIRDRTTKA